MELELLKEVWQKTTNEQLEGYFISKEKIQVLIKKRSTVAVSEIKRGVRNKIFMAGTIGLFMILFSVFSFKSEGTVFSFFESSSNVEVGIFYLLFGLILCFISGFNALSYRRILSIEKNDSNLKSSIKGILIIIKSAIRVKVFSNAFVLPFTVIAIVAISLIRDNGLFSEPGILLIAILSTIAFGVFSYFFSKREQKKRYGAQIKVLEESLNDLESGF